METTEQLVSITVLPPTQCRNFFNKDCSILKTEKGFSYLLLKEYFLREPLCTIGGKTNWYNHYEKQYRGFLKLKMERLGVYVKKLNTLIQEDICAPMVIVILS